MPFTKKEEKEILLIMNNLLDRLNDKRDEYGTSYKKLTHKRVKKEIDDELYDVMGWGLMFLLKKRMLKNRSVQK